MRTVVSLLIIVLILFLGSCSIWVYKDFSTEQDIVTWISENIEYKSETIDYWQPPGETLKLKTGDCEDLCILFMYLAKIELDIDAEMLLVISGLDGKGCHALVSCNGTVYDVHPNRIITSDLYILETYSYSDLLE